MVVLLAWEPITFALYASAIVDRVAGRGVLAVAVLAVRVVATAVGIAAGLALWNERPWALSFARAALGLSAAVAILAWVTGALPSNVAPGLAGPRLAAALAWYGAWMAYLTRVIRSPNGRRGPGA